MEGHKSTVKVMEDHGRSLPDTRVTFQVIGGVWWLWPLGLYCQPQSLSSGIWTLDFKLQTWT